MSSRGRSARIKGASFERNLANTLSEELGIEFKRGLGQTRGVEVSDVYSEKLPWLHIEAKRQKRCNIKAALDQAIEDIADSGKPKMPIAITKDDRSDILVTMKLENWLTIFSGYLKTQ